MVDYFYTLTYFIGPHIVVLLTYVKRLYPNLGRYFIYTHPPPRLPPTFSVFYDKAFTSVLITVNLV